MCVFVYPVTCLGDGYCVQITCHFEMKTKSFLYALLYMYMYVYNATILCLYIIKYNTHHETSDI